MIHPSRQMLYKIFYLFILFSITLNMVKTQCNSCPGMYEKGQGMQHHLKTCPGRNKYHSDLQEKRLAAAEALKKQDKKKRKREKKKLRESEVTMV